MRGITVGQGDLLFRFPLSLWKLFLSMEVLLFKELTELCDIYIWHAYLEEAVVCIICISWQHWDNGFLLALVIYNIMCWICDSVCLPAFPCVFQFHTTYPVSFKWPLGYEIANATKIVKREEVFVFSSQCVASLWSYIWSSMACIQPCGTMTHYEPLYLFVDACLTWGCIKIGMALHHHATGILIMKLTCFPSYNFKWIESPYCIVLYGFVLSKIFL